MNENVKAGIGRLGILLKLCRWRGLRRILARRAYRQFYDVVREDSHLAFNMVTAELTGSRSPGFSMMLIKWLYFAPREEVEGSKLLRDFFRCAEGVTVEEKLSDWEYVLYFGFSSRCFDNEIMNGRAFLPDSVLSLKD